LNCSSGNDTNYLVSLFPGISDLFMKAQEL
jgi:hypothetical protein